MKQSKKILLAGLIPFTAVILISIPLYISTKEDFIPDDDSLELYFRAAEAYERGNLPLCIMLSNSLFRSNPDFHQAGLLMGKAHFFSGEAETALRIFKRIGDSTGGGSDARLWQARAELSTGKHLAAEKTAEKQLSYCPEDPRLLSLMASICTTTENYQKAIEYRRRAALYEEDMGLNRLELARLYGIMLNKSESEANISRSLMLLPDDSRIRAGLETLLEDE